MTSPTTAQPRSTDIFSWVLIAIGAIAIALAMWDVLVEQDGSTGQSLVTGAIGVLVIALGIQRRRGR